MSVKSTSHKQAILQKFERGFAETAKAYDEKLHEVIKSPRLWGGEFGTTRRRNGEVVSGSFRNIYNTGALDQSQLHNPMEPFKSRFSWQGHAVIVHQGATLRNGKKIPARPFTWVAAQELDIPAAFARGVNS